jgi:geranylgeranyl pyrophosphate synthase
VTSTSEALGKTAGKDSASKKATFPETIGLEEALALAKRTEAEAIDTLKRLDRECPVLVDICRYVSRRSS